MTSTDDQILLIVMTGDQICLRADSLPEQVHNAEL